VVYVIYVHKHQTCLREMLKEIWIHNWQCVYLAGTFYRIMTSYRLLILLMLAQTSALHKPRGVTRGSRAHDFCHDHNHEIAIAAHDSWELRLSSILTEFKFWWELMRVFLLVWSLHAVKCVNSHTIIALVRPSIIYTGHFNNALHTGQHSISFKNTFFKLGLWCFCRILQ
jgi:hypothetical protein